MPSPKLQSTPQGSRGRERDREREIVSFWLETKNSGWKAPFFPPAPPHGKSIPSCLPQHVCNMQQKVSLAGTVDSEARGASTLARRGHVSVCTPACVQRLCFGCSRSCLVWCLPGSWLATPSSQGPRCFIPPQAASKTTMLFTLTAWQRGHCEPPDPSLGILTRGRPSWFPSPAHLFLLLSSFIRSFGCFSTSKHLPSIDKAEINPKTAIGCYLGQSGLQMHFIWLTAWCPKFEFAADT